MLLDRLQRPVRGVRIVRKSPSPGDPDAVGVQIIPHRRLNDVDVQRLLTHLGDAPGPIVTSALASSEQDAFVAAGFTEREALHLLRHPLTDIPANTSINETTPHRTRAGRRTDLNAVLDIDGSSFDTFWALDRESLNSARKATPTNRYRVALIDSAVAGYAIAGRAGHSSFLQRLGVAPKYRGNGIGAQLVIDAMTWAKADGATSMLVNTQTKNQTALRLYENLGFVLSPDQLLVLQWAR